MSLVNAVKSLCAHYLFKQWLEFDQTSTDTSSGWGKEIIRFWWTWPYFQGHYIINTQKVSLVNAVKSLCAHYLFNQLLVLLDFGDLDFIFTVTLALWNLNFVRKRFYALCREYRIIVNWNERQKSNQKGKQCRSWWDGSFWAVSSGSTLFAHVAGLVCRAERVKPERKFCKQYRFRWDGS